MKDVEDMEDMEDMEETEDYDWMVKTNRHNRLQTSVVLQGHTILDS